MHLKTPPKIDLLFYASTLGGVYELTVFFTEQLLVLCCLFQLNHQDIFSVDRKG